MPAIPTQMTFFDCLPESGDFVKFMSRLAYEQNAAMRFRVGDDEQQFIKILDFGALKKISTLPLNVRDPIL